MNSAQILFRITAGQRCLIQPLARHTHTSILFKQFKLANMASETLRQRYREFNSTAVTSESQKPAGDSEKETELGNKTPGSKRSLTIAIAGVLALLSVTGYSFMRQPSGVPAVALTTVATPTETALQSVATKRSDAQKRLEGMTKVERRKEVNRLPILTDDEVDAVLRANEKSWQAINGALRIDTDQVSSNEPIEDYLATGDIHGGSRYMVGVFDGHAGFMCAEQLAARMQPMIDAALQEIEGTNKTISAPLSDAVVRLQRDVGRGWDTVPMALTAAFMAMDNELVHASLAEYQRLADPSQMSRLLGPAVSGSCGLVALVDTDANEVVVANTGDSRALLGVRLANGTWKAVRLSQDHTAGNQNELSRLAREHPGETVIRSGRILGGLMPTRAFGDSRYKWPIGVQRALFPQLLANGHKYATSPPDLLSPPYVTAHPVIVRHKLGKGDRFIVVASDGLYDQMADADIVQVVAQWYEARDPASGLVTKDKNAATHLIRAALSTDGNGNRRDEIIRYMLAIPPPVSRRYRDDISVAVITLNEAN
ncbi:phosphatase 2C-like domain-containing protein [Kickxella alabastrina]|uniref:phosphatase 2C-like domain-containing protein n=1 Tax=Kickxella alabastrina TaxID=61397 RepID=UPI002220242F|nr:phosphatase 2C-like domain-containing protein [Kickxella alabastrina]KAI7834438.1 phosphatase 2C-like domain-containing protein [Kickxella alabastrina]